MASPRIVGSPRMTTREVSASKAPARSRHSQEPQQNSSGSFQASPTVAQPSVTEESRMGSGAASVQEAQRKVKAVSASTVIFWTTLPFYVPQVLFWMLGLAGMGLEAVPIADIFVPGQELFFLGYIVAALIGFCSMIYGAWIYVLRGVPCFSGIKALIFICCLTGYFVVFLNLFPWLIFWVMSVILIKDEQ